LKVKCPYLTNHKSNTHRYTNHSFFIHRCVIGITSEIEIWPLEFSTVIAIFIFQKIWVFGHNFMSFGPTRNLTPYICSCQWGLYGNMWIYDVFEKLHILCTSVCILRYEAAQNEDTETSSTSEIIFFRSPDLHFSKIYVYQLHILSDSFRSKGIYPVVWCY
jgi:hypothetical protein